MLDFFRMVIGGARLLDGGVLELVHGVAQAFAVLFRIGDASTVTVNALGLQFHQGLEPSRYGRPGRVPGSVNVPAATLANADKTLVPLADAAAKFAAQGVTRDKTVICYCGGGISATIDLFLLTQLGYDKLALYDASMGEWARDPALPIERMVSHE